MQIVVGTYKIEGVRFRFRYTVANANEREQRYSYEELRGFCEEPPPLPLGGSPAFDACAPHRRHCNWYGCYLRTAVATRRGSCACELARSRRCPRPRTEVGVTSINAAAATRAAVADVIPFCSVCKTVRKTDWYGSVLCALNVPNGIEDCKRLLVDRARPPEMNDVEIRLARVRNPRP